MTQTVTIQIAFINLFALTNLFCFLFLIFLFFIEVFNSRRKHQLDSVQLIDFAGTGIVIHRDNVGFGEAVAQFLDDTLADNMVRQAGERLCADDVVRAAVDQLDHLAGQEPSLAALVADGYEGLRVLGQLADMRGRSEALAFCQRPAGGLAQIFQRVHSQISHECGTLRAAQVLCLVIRIEGTVGEEIQQIRHHSFRSLTLQQIYQLIIRQRQELNENLTDDADSRLLHILMDRKGIELVDHLADISFEFLCAVFLILIRQVGNQLLLPCLMQLVGGAGTSS